MPPSEQPVMRTVRLEADIYVEVGSDEELKLCRM